MNEETRRLSIDFPIKEYIRLKMLCARLQISIKDFVTQAIIKEIDKGSKK